MPSGSRLTPRSPMTRIVETPGSSSFRLTSVTSDWQHMPYASSWVRTRVGSPGVDIAGTCAAAGGRRGRPRGPAADNWRHLCPASPPLGAA
eukprot:scaffold113925_cov41-Phaeocystis_antarctica.AAC.1